ncbi:DUF2953 domain-containing protein [Clostridium estertheticum]|uniref:DUF2953 domain-containing protein n=1 Tax=Clostridium estertheticum TaxID=238834 RepID=A0A7Y3WTT0_9CLOT|nr:DUF2953 domain-containing protein [Clostridium estertheticum]NNU77446.1 DUF2953 domain-containing protein [Clostridium estertheticum]WBL48605.1 DUF2953 domain-containing protein [Clostridium estertheticum]
MFILFLILKILLYLLIFIFGIILLFLIIPFEYYISSKIDEKINVDITLLFFKKIVKVMVRHEDTKEIFLLKIMGLRIIRKEIKSPDIKIEKEEKEKNKKNSKKKKEKKSSFNIRDYIEREFINDLINYFKDIINIVKPKTVKINGFYGFDDPSLTGMICGIIPLISNLIPKSNINLQPVFDDEIIEIECDVHGKISLLSAIIKTLKFIFKKNNRQKIFKKA